MRTNPMSCNSNCIYYSRPKNYERLIQCDRNWQGKSSSASPLFFNPPQETTMNTQGWFYFTGDWKGDLNNLLGYNIVLNFNGSGIKGIWHPSVKVNRFPDGFPTHWSKDYRNEQKEKLNNLLQNT